MLRERCGHMSGLSARSKTAGLDEVRDAEGLIKATRCMRIAGTASSASGFRPTSSSLSSCALPLCPTQAGQITAFVLVGAEAATFGAPPFR